ncbi:cold-shock protein [Yimella sp. cx-51]|uniref:cold-shock protein n=1 Tax=Yimella sp. cx-51 TaxID=2770551 RepID=UPI00165E8278|nr:hypothetical protein [Yimella sp. cx-51]MBC9956717.1 hypothetical protein [Yimella sp. cx-51]QTH38955.1 hypothetical protein J5M86_04820 [Yimella sp. cx-51]
MQGTVHTFDAATGSGTVLTDNGREITFGSAAFAASGLIHVRPGQRISLEMGATGITRIWIDGIGQGQRIR